MLRYFRRVTENTFVPPPEPPGLRAWTLRGDLQRLRRQLSKREILPSGRRREKERETERESKGAGLLRSVRRRPRARGIQGPRACPGGLAAACSLHVLAAQSSSLARSPQRTVLTTLAGVDSSDSSRFRRPLFAALLSASLPSKLDASSLVRERLGRASSCPAAITLALCASPREPRGVGAVTMWDVWLINILVSVLLGRACPGGGSVGGSYLRGLGCTPVRLTVYSRV